MARRLRDDLKEEKRMPFFDNLFQNLFELMLANILFVLCCVPVVTAGPAAIALERVCCLIHREEKVASGGLVFSCIQRFLSGGSGFSSENGCYILVFPI